MSRSQKKGVFYPLFFFKKFSSLHVLKDRFCRSVKVPFEFTEKSGSIYNGKMFSKFVGSPLVLGQRFGEFIPTRAIYIPKKKIC